MFCGKCGLKNDDDANFCAGCGANLKPEQNVNGETSVSTNSSNKNRNIGIIAVVAAVMIVVSIIAFFHPRGYKVVVDECLNAIFNVNATAMFELVPEEVIDYLEGNGYERYELIDESNENNQAILDDLFEDDDWEWSYEITSAEDITGDDLADLKSSYEHMDVKVSSAKTVKVQVTFKIGEADDIHPMYSADMDISVIKVRGSWYLDMENSTIFDGYPLWLW